MSPLLTSSTPFENQGHLAANRDIVLTFNAAMLAGAGTVTISDGASQTYVNKQGVSVTRLVNATDTRTISILDSSQVTIDGNTVTLHLNTPLKSGMAYSVQVGSGALLDASGAAFTGLRDATGLRFTTLPAAAPLALVDSVIHFLDSGSSASDYLTNVGAQSVSGTYSGKLALGEFVEVSLDNGLHWSRATAVASTGAWSLNGTISASDTALARVSNSDGLSSATASQSYLFDTTGPQLANIDLSTAAIAPGATALVTIMFSEKVATLGANALTVSGGGLAGLGTLDGGLTWSATLTPLAGQSGTGRITLDLTGVTDLAGNAGTGLVTGPNYTYGPVTPVPPVIPVPPVTQPPVTPALAQVSGTIAFTDSGSSASDYITNVVAQTLQGSYSGALASGETVEVSTDNGATWHRASADAGLWSYRTDLAGSSTMQARVLRAGGAAGDTISQAYVLDRTPPTVTTNLHLDDGNLGIGETATVSVTFSEKMTQLGATTVTASAGTLSAFTTSDGLTWSATLTPPAGQFGEGNLTLYPNLFYDVAGNGGADTVSGASYSYHTVPITVLKVTAPPHEPDPTHEDGAYRPGDTIFITVTFSEKVHVGEETPTLDMGTYYPATYASGSGTDALVFQYLVRTGTGTDNLQYAGTHALSGSINYRENPVDLSLPAPDAAGNLGSDPDHTIAINAPYPALRLDPSDDSGRSNSDGITNSTCVTITSDPVGAGDEIVLSDEIVLPDGTVKPTIVVSSVIADPDGNWHIKNEMGSEYTEGLHHMSVTVRPFNSAVPQELAPDITIDSEAPTASLGNSPLMLGDATYFNTALPTNDDTPTITIAGMRNVSGLRVNDTIDLGDGSGSAYAYGSYTIQAGDIDGNGRWIGDDAFNVTVSNALSEGYNEIQVSIGELASDQHGASSSIQINVDKTAPTLDAENSTLGPDHPHYNPYPITLAFSEEVKLNADSQVTIYSTSNPNTPALTLNNSDLLVIGDTSGHHTTVSLGLISLDSGDYTIEIAPGSISDEAGNAVDVVGMPVLSFTSMLSP